MIEYGGNLVFRKPFNQLSGINLGAIKYELQAREKKIRSLHAEKLKLRALLKKAKTTIDTINNNYK